MLRRAIKLYSFFLKEKSVNKTHCGSLPKAIAYFMTGGIGDGIMALPAINKLRSAFPSVAIDIYVRPNLFEFTSFLLPDYRVKYFYRWSIFLFCLKPLFKKYDVSFTSVIGVYDIYMEIASYIASRYSCGFRYESETMRDRLYSFSAPVRQKVHDSEQNMSLVTSVLGLKTEEPDYVLEKRHKEQQVPLQKTVFIHPGVKKGYEKRCWPLENYNILIDRLKARNYFVKVILGPEEKSIACRFKASNENDILFLNHPAELVKVLNGAFLFIGNDSGPAHVADHLDIPSIVLFGPADPERTAPRGKNTIVIYKNKNCSPCHYASAKCKKNICMTDISVEDVLGKIKLIENGMGEKSRT